MIKIFAGIIVIISCSGFGFVMASEIYARIKYLEKLKKLLIHLRSEINYAKTPLSQAFYSIADRQEGVLKEFCLDMADKLEELSGHMLGELWILSVDSKIKNVPLKLCDIDEFKMIGNRLGFQDYEMQLSAIDIEVQYLDEKISDLKTVIEQKQKIYRALGIFSGLMITILFI